MLNFGVIGTGAIARDFCIALASSQRCRVAHVAGSNADRAEAFAEAFGLRRASGDLSGLLGDPAVDAVYVATPNPLHAPQVLAAIAAGKPVLCEKPMSTSAAVTARLIDAAGQRGVLLMEGWMYRCHPLIAALITSIESGTIGTLVHIRADFGFAAERQPGQRLFDPALGGGAILDVGGYPMSFARLFAGVAIGQPYAEPLSLTGTRHVGPTGVDELATALLRFESGISAELGCAIRHRLGTQATLFGTHGRITVPDPWLPGGQRQGLTASFTIHRDGAADEPVTVTADQPVYALEAEWFADSLATRDTRWPAMGLQESQAQAQAIERWQQV